MAEVTKQTATDKPTPHFPDDILIELFLRLPVRSLFFFRSVCKHWLYLIQNPNFIRMHNKLTINNSRNIHNPMLIMRTIESKVVLTLLSDDETLAYKDDVALEVISPSMASRVLGHDDKLHLLGPCNGFFCLSDMVDVVLLNPAIRQFRNVPRSSFSGRNKNWYRSNAIDYFSRVGFGFDTVSKDYKVVRFHDQKELDDIYDIDFDASDDGDHHLKVELFTLSTNCWRELDHTVTASYMPRIRDHSLFFNGAFHWLRGDYANYFDVILVFDLNKEDFKQFKLPLPGGYSEDVEDIFMYLSIVNKSLALIVRKENDYLGVKSEFKIWVMTKYGVEESWTNLYSISPDVGIKRPLSFSNKWEFLVEINHGQVASYNLETKTIKKFQVDGNKWSWIHAFRYSESLTSLK